MNKALNEVKIQAKKLLKTARLNHPPSLARVAKFNRHKEASDELKLKHCQHTIAREIGFNDWQHAQQVLIGNTQSDENPDMGTFWHKPACNALLNLWFSGYQEAQAYLGSELNHYIFPYKKQFVVAKQEYVAALGLSEAISSEANDSIRDFVSTYPSEEWDKLAEKMIMLRYTH